MFWPLILILLCLLVGRVLLRTFDPSDVIPAKVSSGIIVGSVLFSLVALGSSYFVGLKSGIILTSVIFFSVIVVNFRHLVIPQNGSIRPLEKKLIFTSVILGLILFRLFETHSLPRDNQGNLFTGESTYGDLPFHLGIISQFANFGKIPPENPLYSGQPLAYPYLIDFFTAVLVTTGLTLRDSLIVTGMIFSLSLIFILYEFTYFLTKKSSVACLSIFLFFLHGGLGFYYFLRDTGLGKTSFESLLNPAAIKEYSHLFSENIQWSNFLSRMIVPERSLLFGIPLGLIILRMLLVKKNNLSLGKDLILTAILLGALPLAHTHTLLVMIPILIGISLRELPARPLAKWLAKWSIVVTVSLIVASPGLNEILLHLQSSSQFFKINLWWMSDARGPLIFWIKNTGLFIPLLAIPLFWKRTPPDIKFFGFIAIILFASVNFFQFQPYDWDNIKFLIWFTLFGAILAAITLSAMWHTRVILFRLTAVVITLTLVSSALLSIYRESFVRYTLFTSSDTRLASWAKTNTPPQAIFLTAPIHNSFVNNLAGRRIVMGYPGMLWVHGIDYSQREKEVKSIYNLLPGFEDLIVRNNIDYIVKSPYEINQYQIDQGEFDRRFCLVFSLEQFRIYRPFPCVK